MFDKFFKKHKFKDSKKQAVFTCCHIIEENKPILYVNHDDEEDWQFLCGENHITKDARIIALQEIVNIIQVLTKYQVSNAGRLQLEKAKKVNGSCYKTI